MKQFIYFLAAIVMINSSCGMVDGKRVRGNGNIVKENRSIRPFDYLEVNGAFEVRITQDSIASLIVEADDNLLPFISINEDGDRLIFNTKDGYSLRPSHKLIIHISNPRYHEFDISGASSIKSQNQIGNGQPLKFDLSGASELDLDVRAEKITVGATGASQIRLKGQAKDLHIGATGATKIWCFDLLTENAYVGLTGAGYAEVFASVTLKASVSGAGDIRYKGDAVVTRDISGAGSIKKQ